MSKPTEERRSGERRKLNPKNSTAHWRVNEHGTQYLHPDERSVPDRRAPQAEVESGPCAKLYDCELPAGHDGNCEPESEGVERKMEEVYALLAGERVLAELAGGGRPKKAKGGAHRKNLARHAATLARLRRASSESREPVVHKLPCERCGKMMAVPQPTDREAELREAARHLLANPGCADHDCCATAIANAEARERLRTVLASTRETEGGDRP